MSDVQTFSLARRGDYARGFFTRWMDLTSVYSHQFWLVSPPASALG